MLLGDYISNQGHEVYRSMVGQTELDTDRAKISQVRCLETS